MKTAAILLITLFLVYSFTVPFVAVSFEGLIMPKGSPQPLKTGMAPDISNERWPTNYSLTQDSRSMIRVYTGENQSAIVVLGDQQNLTYMNVGLSTIIKPPTDVESKIDANLLNLTRLVTKGYIQNNQTNVIITVSNEIPVEKITFAHTFDKAYKSYTSKNAYSRMHFLAAHLNYSTIFELAKSSQVDHIWLDRKFQVYLDQSVKIIKDPAEWARIESSFGGNINGSGVKIAILDTGIDSTHPDFSFPNGTSKIVGAISFTGESTADGFGHGTHVASIAAGTGAASAGQYVGVAPGAALLNVKVLNNQGEGFESWIISGIQWAADSDANILSMSFGGSVGSDGIDPLSTVINWATEQGVISVAAAGNSGSDMYSITSPGVAELAITVGASSKGDVVASFSSRGPTNDRRIKPDVLAPGVDIVAARASGTSMSTPISYYYTKASGTSMATPHVAGAAALLLDAHPSWNPPEVKMALTNYAEDIGGNVFEQGSGRINICKAAEASLVGNSSISFGRVGLNTISKSIIVFQNLANRILGVTMDAEAWHIGDNTHYQTVSLNVSSLYLSSFDTRKVELSLNTNVELPSGYFEGRIIATFGTTSIRIPFFFCIISQLNVEVKDEKGLGLLAAYVLIDAATGQIKAYSTEVERAQFIISPGDYVIQAMDVYGWNPSGSMDASISFLVHRRFSIGEDQTISLELSLSSAYKLKVRSTDITGSPIHLKLKQLLTPYYSVAYISEIGTFINQYLYLTNTSEYMGIPCYFGFAGFSEDYVYWTQTGVLTSEVNAYFIGWDISKFGLPPIPNALNYTDSELATFDIENMLPESSTTSTIWFNQVAGMWQSGLWHGFQTHPGISWKIHLLPYQLKTAPSASWSELEWSCIYALSSYPGESAEYYVIDRHFQPITKGETLSYYMGKTPLIPQPVYDNAPYYGSGLFIPCYPLLAEKNLFLAKTDFSATKRVEVLKDGIVIYNGTTLWAQTPISISQFLKSHGFGLYSFIVKSETSLDYSSQNVAEYVINYTSSSIDLIPPSIERIDCTPFFVNPEYQVRIQLADNDELHDVSLQYSIDTGPWLSSTLNYLGDRQYSANITIPPTAQSISLTVEAADRSGNSIRFSTKPVAKKGYQTQIDAVLSADRIIGKLTVLGGSLPQPVYLKVKAGEEVMHVLTDPDGSFGFTVPQQMKFPIALEMVGVGSYSGSVYIINKSQVHDVSVTQIVPSERATSGNIHIYVTVVNQGDNTETFGVTVSANTTQVAMQEVTMNRGANITITFTWNTTGFAKGNYTISAYAWPVPGETDTSDNTFTDGTVKIGVRGDLNDDNKCNILDLVKEAGKFGAEKGDPHSPPYPKYDPNYDFNDDNKINILDMVKVAIHFGETDP
jgi:serine protease AprX